MILKPGDLIGQKYRILKIIGSGGMGIVYLVVNERSNKLWAAKSIRQMEGSQAAMYHASLMRELVILRKLHHKSLPQVIDVVEDSGNVFLLMDYIKGVSLDQWIGQRHRPGKREIMEILLQLGQVLSYLHTRVPPIVYGDLKPSNIMIKASGEVVLLDFGIARALTKVGEKGQVWGTKGFAPPEGYSQGGDLSVSWDIYGLGAVGYYLRSGHPPASPEHRLVHRSTHGLDKVILKALEQEPKARYASCRGFMADLKRWRQRQIAKHILEIGFVGLFLIMGVVLGVDAGRRSEAVISPAEQSVSYEDYLLMATENPLERETYLKSAIEMDPANSSAYQQLLACYQEDGNFSETEALEWMQLFQTKAWDREESYREILAKDTEAYFQVLYELGMAYYYNYEGEGNKILARPWFEALEALTLDVSTKTQKQEQQQVRVGILLRMGRYYAYLSGDKNQSGDVRAAYGTYWEDLCELKQMANKDTMVTELKLFEEIIALVYVDVHRLVEARVSLKEIEGVLQEIEERSAALTHLAETAYEIELCKRICTGLEKAKDRVAAAKEL